MNSFLLKAMLNRYAQNPPKPEEVDALFSKYQPQLASVDPSQLDALKPQYPALAPAIDQIKSRIAQAMAQSSEKK